MYIEITSPTDGRVFIRADSIASVAVGKKTKGEPFVVTTLTGATYSVTVDTEQNSLARLVGLRG
jgi:hypothetical protein